MLSQGILKLLALDGTSQGLMILTRLFVRCVLCLNMAEGCFLLAQPDAARRSS